MRTLITSFYNYKEQICRMWFWAWKMRKNYDFDAHYIYHIIYHKLDRVYNTMENHGHLVWNSNTNNPGMRRLSEARMLAKRLMNDDYNRNIYLFYDRYTYENSNFGFLHARAKILKDIKLYNYMFKSAYQRDNNQKNTESKRLFNLLETNINSWWD